MKLLYHNNRPYEHLCNIEYLFSFLCIYLIVGSFISRQLKTVFQYKSITGAIPGFLGRDPE